MTRKVKKVRCLVCNEILTYDNDDTSVLVDHLNLEHSGLDVFRFLAHCQVSSSKGDKRGTGGDNCCMEGGDKPSDCALKSKTYRTTVEKWTPGPNCIICPMCFKEGQPIVKKQKNKIAKSPLGALCMLGCWPFCFLPFLFRKEQFLDLYCCSCKAYLGTYDKKKGSMTRSAIKDSDTSLCHRLNPIGIPPPLYDVDETDSLSDVAREKPCDCHIMPESQKPEGMEFEAETMMERPPSYSSILKKQLKGESSEDAFILRNAPPTYNDITSVYMIPSSRQIERFCAIPSFSEPIWRSHSQPAHCPRCDVMVLTITRAHESLATHITAMALCLFGCWPCCLLPYCLNVCKNTYHICPICKGYLGAYTPW